MSVVKTEEFGNRSKSSPKETEMGRELYHIDAVVQAVEIALPALYSEPLDSKKARRLLSRAWNGDVKSVELMRQKWGRSWIQTEREVVNDTADERAIGHNAQREGLFMTAVGYAKDQPELVRWSKGGKEVTPTQAAFAKLALNGLLKATPEKVLKKLMVEIGALELPLPVQIQEMSVKSVSLSFATQSRVEV